MNFWLLMRPPTSSDGVLHPRRLITPAFGPTRSRFGDPLRGQSRMMSMNAHPDQPFAPINQQRNRARGLVPGVVGRDTARAPDHLLPRTNLPGDPGAAAPPGDDADCRSTPAAAGAGAPGAAGGTRISSGATRQVPEGWERAGPHQTRRATLEALDGVATRTARPSPVPRSASDRQSMPAASIVASVPPPLVQSAAAASTSR